MIVMQNQVRSMKPKDYFQNLISSLETVFMDTLWVKLWKDFI